MFNVKQCLEEMRLSMVGLEGFTVPNVVPNSGIVFNYYCENPCVFEVYVGEDGGYTITVEGHHKHYGSWRDYVDFEDDFYDFEEFFDHIALHYEQWLLEGRISDDWDPSLIEAERSFSGVQRTDADGVGQVGEGVEPFNTKNALNKVLVAAKFPKRKIQQTSGGTAIHVDFEGDYSKYWIEYTKQSNGSWVFKFGGNGNNFKKDVNDYNELLAAAKEAKKLLK